MGEMRWPELPWDAWADTADTLHMWTQIVGKTRLALTPLQNHWWNVPLYVTARGLGTSAMAYGTMCWMWSSTLWRMSCICAWGRGRVLSRPSAGADGGGLLQGVSSGPGRAWGGGEDHADAGGSGESRTV